MKKTFLIIAGETSGDTHAAHLVESMKRRGDVRVIGVGGDRMRAAGVELLHHVKEMSVMGFSEVFTKLLFFRRVRSELLRTIENERPSAVILVDYPGFNLRFARSAKERGMKVFYFISPQVWAWGKRRIKKIRRNVDLMLTVFKFEEDMYRLGNVRAQFVGHPLLDEMRPHSDSEVKDFRSQHTSSANNRILALLPGSRLQEIRRILPTMIESARVLAGQTDFETRGLEAVIGCAPGIDEDVYEHILGEPGMTVRLTHDVDLLMCSADAGIVTSGTATLEAALHNLPMLVVYKTGTVNYLIGRLLVRLDSISLVNIVARKPIVRELVQGAFKPAEAAAVLKDLLVNNGIVEEIRNKYSDLRKILGGPGASDRAAELILGMSQ